MSCNCKICKAGKRGMKLATSCPRIKIATMQIIAARRKLRVKWNAELAEDINAFKEIDLDVVIK